jgi:hypothetical protein
VRVLGHLVGMELVDVIVGGGSLGGGASEVFDGKGERDDRHFGKRRICLPGFLCRKSFYGAFIDSSTAERAAEAWWLICNRPVPNQS